MLYWGPMWTTCTACTFVSKLWNPLHDYNSQSALHLRLVWIPLHSPTLVRVCLSVFPTYFNYHIFIFIVSPKIRSQHWKLTFTHLKKNYIFLFTDLDDLQFFFEMFVFHTSFMNTSIISFSPILFSFLENCAIFNTHKNFHTRKRKNKQSYFLPNSTSLNI